MLIVSNLLQLINSIGNLLEKTYQRALVLFNDYQLIIGGICNFKSFQLIVVARVH